MEYTNIGDIEKVEIRKATLEDANKIAGYMLKVAAETDYLTFGENEVNRSIEFHKKSIIDCLNEENQLFIGAILNDEIIGILKFYGGKKPRVRHTGELGITVLKKYWNRGIGKIMIDYLFNWAVDSKIVKKINLIVRGDNERAIKFYYSLGFKNEGTRSREFLINGEFYDRIMMGIEIN